MRIGVVAPSTPIDTAVAAQVIALAARLHPGVDIAFHPQCFLSHNHFAGTDAERTEALVGTANDPAIDAVWFARGGYGSCRIASDAIARLGAAARGKTYLGYSDAGYLLAGLLVAGFGDVVHGPMPRDIIREGGEAAVSRALDWLVNRDPATLEPSVDADAKAAAFNMTVFSQLLGTPLEPDLDGQVLMLEDVSEYMYRIDRALFHITSQASVQRVAGIRLGRCTDVPENDPDFGDTEEDIVRHWCGRAGIPYLGRADIGHDAQNKVVPLGRGL